MNEYDIKRLALVLAVQAEIEGMKAHNKRLQMTGISPNYGQADFDVKAEELRVLASKHNEQL